MGALLCASLNSQQWCGKTVVPNDDGDLGQSTKDNLAKFANNLSGDLRVRPLHWGLYQVS
jgi:hypothetical protein